MPDGSVWYKCGVPSSSKPPIRQDIPNGRRPLLWVYFCFKPAIKLRVDRRSDTIVNHHILALPRNILQCYWILDGQFMALAFYLSSINKHTGVSCEACKCHHNMIVQSANFSYSSLLLQFGDAFLFDGQHNGVPAAYANLIVVCSQGCQYSFTV